MTAREVEIIRRTNSTVFAIYSYVKAFPRSRNMDIEVDLGLSDKTVIASLKRLTEDKIIKRTMATHRIREITVMPEQEWEL
jgi:DNA-binding Lrp family transcriptional regulator